MITPFCWGPSERRLFATYHPPAAAGLGARAVLLANPFGQEAVRAHRLYRVLAERIARSGASAMRFDLYGTGDSGGDDEDGDFDGWVQDLLSAHAELCRRSHAIHVTWVGARLGAAIALRAAGHVAPDRLLLWDPIWDGPTYLQTLREKHLEALERSFGLGGPNWRQRLAVQPALFDGEAMGFAIAGRLRQQLARLEPGVLKPPTGVDVQIVADSCDSLPPAWATSSVEPDVQIRRVSLRHDFDWTAEEALNTALVPAHVVQCFMKLLAVPE